MAGKDFGDNGKRKSEVGLRKGKSGYDADFRGYINLNLTPAEKEAYGEWLAADTFWEVLDLQVTDGVNLAVKRDPKGEGFLASATHRREDSVNAGLVVTARGKTPSVALGRCVYCLALLTRSESWEETQPMSDPDRW